MQRARGQRERGQSETDKVFHGFHAFPRFRGQGTLTSERWDLECESRASDAGRVRRGSGRPSCGYALIAAPHCAQECVKATRISRKMRAKSAPTAVPRNLGKGLLPQTPSRSTSNFSVAFGGITPPAP